VPTEMRASASESPTKVPYTVIAGCLCCTAGLAWQHRSMKRQWVMDREAYNERRAIMEVNKASDATCLDIARHASDVAYKTRFGQVCTDAANGDWTAAEAWMKEIRGRFGIQARIVRKRSLKLITLLHDNKN
jgi:hypothetical protein